MNKKGYTLVEIIVSFSLIVLIIGLVYQMFTKEIANSKKNAYERQISTIISVAKDYHLQNPDTTFVMVDDLKGLGLIDNEIVDPRNGTNITGCVKFIKDAYYNQYKYEYFNVSKDECQK